MDNEEGVPATAEDLMQMNDTQEVCTGIYILIVQCNRYGYTPCLMITLPDHVILIVQ